MALTMRISPQSAWIVRGQKIIFVVESDDTGQTGFKYGVKVTDQTSGKVYSFLYDPEPTSLKLLFDLYPLINLMNEELTINPHFPKFSEPVEEPEGSGWRRYELEFSENWLIDGVLVKNTETIMVEDEYAVFNAYYQQSDGFAPDVENGITNVRFALNSNSASRLWSDRFYSTHDWEFRETFGISPTAICIPAFASDFGSLACQKRLQYMKTNEAHAYRLTFAHGDIDNVTLEPVKTFVLKDHAFQHIGVYPMNLTLCPLIEDVPNPTTFPNWLYYEIRVVNNSNQPESVRYVFYNAERFGQHDCRHDKVRLAWVSSRGGYDYFNFIKKSETSNQIERKQFARTITLSPELPIFYSNARALVDRQNIVQQFISIQSDWIQEQEFVFLRSLFASNQVMILNDDGTSTPVSIDDQTFIEKKNRDGKLYNLTIRLKISHLYWT